MEEEKTLGADAAAVDSARSAEAVPQLCRAVTAAGRECLNYASVERDGQWYCRVHCRDARGLAPCPFCGKDAAPGTITYAETSDVARLNKQTVFHFIKCVWCGANNQALIGYSNIEKAIRHWNTRIETGSVSANSGIGGTRSEAP